MPPSTPVAARAERRSEDAPRRLDPPPPPPSVLPPPIPAAANRSPLAPTVEAQGSDGAKACDALAATIATALVPAPPAADCAAAAAASQPPAPPPTQRSGVPAAVLWLVLCRLDACDLDYPAAAVCTDWRTAARAILSLGTLVGCTPEHEVVLADELSFYAAFPRARKIAEGGWKRVYRADGAARGAAAGASALAVVDVVEAERLGVRAQLQLEMSAMHFCSLLVSTGGCPNFVELHATFLLAFPLPPTGWDRPDAAAIAAALAAAAARADAEAAGDQVGTADEVGAGDEVAPAARTGGRVKQPRPRRRAAAAESAPRADTPAPASDEADAAVEALLQVAHMELCAADLEALTAGVALPMDDVLCYALQMCAALHVAQRALHLVHYDVKLLNFFARTPREAPAGIAPGEAIVELTYVLPARGGATGGSAASGDGEVRLRVALDAARPTLCLLSDFGTADVGGDSLGAPICAHHLSTYENTPPDFLLLGARATQGAAADSWALGLALLHLCTGHAPYEELCAPLRCPAPLREALVDAWAGGREYAPVRKALARDDDGVLADTLYRYMIVLGLPTNEAALAGWLDGSRAALALHRWARAQPAELTRDAAAFSLGSGRAFELARARMAEAPGLAELVRSLLAWEPGRRTSPERAMRTADAFAPLRVGAGETGRARGASAPWCVCAREYVI